MIVKTRTAPTPDSWRFFEADQVQCSRDVSGADAVAENVERHEFRSGGKRGFVLISFYDQHGNAIEILTDMDSFLLSNTGQTIERLR